MWNYLTEKFFTEYFLYETILGDYFGGKTLFHLLGDIFLLSDGEKAFADRLLESENISEIRTESDYMRYRRAKKYFALTGTGEETDSNEDTAITLKGAAIAIAKSIGCASALTKIKTEENLSAAASGGNIAAMRAAGIMLSEGILFTKNTESGLRYLRMSAEWNDVPSLLYSLYYDKAYTRRYAGKLAFLLKEATHDEILPLIEERYGSFVQPGEPREAMLLERLFRLNVLKRETYSAPRARALFSRAISYKDKEKLLYTAGSDYMPMVGDLPLKLGGGRAAAFDYGAFAVMPLARGAEQQRIISRLDNSDLRGMHSYRPLCLSSSSVCLLRIYADVISACAAGANIEYINVGGLDIHRLDHGKNNVFIRSCDEDRENIYCMFFTGDIPDIVAEQAKAFLKSEGRSRFSISVPNISLDLSSILPICFCDLKNEKQLREICDVIRVEECSNEEKPWLLQYITREKAELYGIPEIKSDDGLKQRLLSLDIDDMEDELDIEVSANRRKNEKLFLTEKNYSGLRSAEERRYGFGGFRQ